jgi:hypothetical protein
MTMNRLRKIAYELTPQDKQVITRMLRELSEYTDDVTRITSQKLSQISAPVAAPPMENNNNTEKKASFVDDTKEKIFMRDNYNRKVSLHAMLLMNYYCKLVSSGARIEKFEREKEWADGKIRSDAFVVFKIGRNFGDEKEATIRQIVEVHVSHNHPNLERYEWLWDTQEVQRECNYEADRFPDIVLIDDINHIKPFVFPRIRIIHLDFKLDEFTKVFL